MPCRAFAFAALLAAACGGQPDDSSRAPYVATDGLSLELCGSVGAWTPPTEEADGSLSIDDHAWAVVAGAKVVGAELLAEGSEICAGADLDKQRRIVSCTIVPPPSDPWKAAGYE